MVVFGELGGDASEISLVKRSVSGVCAEVYENHPTTKDLLVDNDKELGPKIHLNCAKGQTISSIKFASYVTSSGTCGSFVAGSCHAADTNAVLEKHCVGLESCKLPIMNGRFGGDPCPNVLMKLSAEAICS